MAKKPTRVEINRAAMTDFENAIATGLADIMVETQRRATQKPLPDDPETSRKMSATAGWAVYKGTKKVDGFATKPRTLRPKAAAITAVVGFGHPLANIFERGTAGRYQKSGDYAGAIKARPFLLPAFLASVKDLAATVGQSIRQSPVSKPGKSTVASAPRRRASGGSTAGSGTFDRRTIIGRRNWLRRAGQLGGEME